MIEHKLKLLSILSDHTADCVPHDLTPLTAEELHVNEYTEMFNLVANDVMNILYGEEELESAGDAIKDLEIGCESTGVSFIEVNRHGKTYLNLLLQQSKIDCDTHTLLIKLFDKTQLEPTKEK